MTAALKYLQGYPEAIQTQVRELADKGEIATVLLRKYHSAHEVRSDRALYDYVVALKNQYLRGAQALSKVCFDNKLQLVAQALGTHTTVSRVQGAKLRAKREIRIASMFRDMPIAFLRMIAVHELAHTRERAHDKAFYQLCTYMEPDYHQIEFDLRLYLTQIDLAGELDWSSSGSA